MESIKQGNISLEQHSKSFDTQLQNMKSLGMLIEEKSIIYTYLISLNSSYKYKVTELISSTDDDDEKFPQIGHSMESYGKSDDQS